MKIDVTKIEGYENMTFEEKVAALEGLEFQVPEVDMTKFVSKDLFDKTASEVAEWKRKHNALLSEEERKKAEHDDEMATLRKTVELMEQERTITEIKANYMSMGYDEDLADDTARATIEGDNKRIFQNHKKFLESHDKKFEAELIAKTPRPSGAGTQGSHVPLSKSEILEIRDPEERQRRIAENVELFE